MRAADKRLQLAMESADLGAWSWDLHDGATATSERCLMLYGIAANERLDFDRLLAALHPDDRRLTRDIISQSIAECGTYDVSHRVLDVETADGVRWVRARGRVEGHADGTAERLHGIVFDIDRQKRAEMALRDDRDRLEARVAERTRALAMAAAELTAEMQRREEMQSTLVQAQKLEALGQLTGGVAHDFNNILVAIMGSLELITLYSSDDPRVNKLAQNGFRAAERAAALIRQLLAFARRENLAPTVLDPGALLAGAEELLSSAIGAGTRLSWQSAQDVWPVVADRHLLEVALLNLAMNARDAMADTGEILISTRNVPADDADGARRDWPHGVARTADHVVFAVTDTGPGMPPSVLARAMEPFFTTKPQGKGTGLGLAMVHGFAHQSGGGVRIVSAEGEGTTVEIWLPRAIDAPLLLQPIADRRVDPNLHGDATILVVDDDEQVRLVTVMMLRHMGYDVLEASTAENALIQTLAAPRLDLLVTDVVMPGVHGPGLVERIHADLPSLPVLFITGYADRHDLSGHLVLTKPFSPADLGERVLAALDRLPHRDVLLARVNRREIRRTYLAWRQLRDAAGVDSLPAISSFVPGNLPAPANSYIVEMREDQSRTLTFRFLYIGDELKKLLVRSVEQEVFMEDDLDANVFPGLAEAFRRSSLSNVPFHDAARYDFGDGEDPVEFERLLLPLAAPQGDMATIMLGVSFLSGAYRETKNG